jgi:hypothetical protein
MTASAGQCNAVVGWRVGASSRASRGDGKYPGGGIRARAWNRFARSSKFVQGSRHLPAHSYTSTAHRGRARYCVNAVTSGSWQLRFPLHHILCSSDPFCIGISHVLVAGRSAPRRSGLPADATSEMKTTVCCQTQANRGTRCNYSGRNGRTPSPGLDHGGSLWHLRWRRQGCRRSQTICFGGHAKAWKRETEKKARAVTRLITIRERYVV